jgi:tetratricopeptide (TPR) repeat protein
MGESFPHIPLWLDEGLAEFFGNSEIQEKDVLLGKPSTADIFLLRHNKLLPLATLFAVDHSSPYYNEQSKGSIFYAESWALTHYFMVGSGKEEDKKSLDDFLALLREGVNSANATPRAFGDLSQLQGQLAEYIQQNRFNYRIVKGSTEVNEDDFKVRELSPADSTALRGDFMIYNQRQSDARAILQEALAEDPNNAQAAESMGFLEFRQGQRSEARKWLAQAARLNSQSYLANYYFAVLSIQESAQGQDAPQVESSLRAAIKINPNFAPAYDALGGFYGMRGERLEEARILELQAVELEPNNVRFRVNMGNLLLRMQRGDDALKVGELALEMAKTPEDTAMAETFLESAQKYQEYLASVKRIRARAEAEKKEADDLGQNTDADSVDNPPHSEANSDSSPTRGTHRKAVTYGSIASGTEETTSPIVHRDSATQGPREVAEGKIVTVKCSSPALMDLTFVADGRSLLLHSENYYRVAYSALNFTPSQELQPCRQLEGMHAQIRYYHIKGQSYVGEMISILLSK